MPEDEPKAKAPPDPGPLDSGQKSQPNDSAAQNQGGTPKPEASPQEGMSAESEMKARLERPEYKQRQERFKIFEGMGGASDRYRHLPNREPALPIEEFIIEKISNGLISGRLLILECIEQRFLQDIRLWLRKRSEFAGYVQIAPNLTSGATQIESIDQYLDVRGPAMLVLTATLGLMESFSNQRELFNFERITDGLRARDILVLVCTDANVLSRKRIREDRHLARFRIRANAVEHWLLPLLTQSYGDNSKRMLEVLIQQRNAGSWPSDDREFHAMVTASLDEKRLEEELKNRGPQSRSGNRWSEATLEDILQDSSKDLETRALFLRAFLSSSSVFTIEICLETLVGKESESWKRYGTERRQILELVQDYQPLFSPGRVRDWFEGDRWLFVKLSQEILDKLLLNPPTPDVGTDCLSIITAATVTDPQGFGYNVVFRTIGIRGEVSEKAWEESLGATDRRKTRLKVARSLVSGLAQQSSTVHIIRDSVQKLIEWGRFDDVLELLQDLALTSDLREKQVCDYYARALNEGTEETRADAVQKLRERTWRSPLDFADVLRATISWLPSDVDGPSHAVFIITDVVVEALEARLIRDSIEGRYEAHPRMLNLVGTFGDDFLDILLPWFSHAFVKRRLDELSAIHQSFLIDMWMVPVGLRARVFQDSQHKNIEFLISALAGLIGGLASSASSFQKSPPPLFAGLFLVEWVLADGSVKSLSRLEKKELASLAACWSATDRAIEYGMAAIGRLSGKPRPAIEFAKRIRSAIKSLRSARSQATSA